MDGTGRIGPDFNIFFINSELFSGQNGRCVNKKKEITLLKQKEKTMCDGFDFIHSFFTGDVVLLMTSSASSVRWWCASQQDLTHMMMGHVKSDAVLDEAFNYISNL